MSPEYPNAEGSTYAGQTPTSTNKKRTYPGRTPNLNQAVCQQGRYCTCEENIVTHPARGQCQVKVASEQIKATVPVQQRLTSQAPCDSSWYHTPTPEKPGILSPERGYYCWNGQNQPQWTTPGFEYYGNPNYEGRCQGWYDANGQSLGNQWVDDLTHWDPCWSGCSGDSSDMTLEQCQGRDYANMCSARTDLIQYRIKPARGGCNKDDPRAGYDTPAFCHQGESSAMGDDCYQPMLAYYVDEPNTAPAGGTGCYSFKNTPYWGGSDEAVAPGSLSHTNTVVGMDDGRYSPSNFWRSITPDAGFPICKCAAAAPDYRFVGSSAHSEVDNDQLLRIEQTTNCNDALSNPWNNNKQNAWFCVQCPPGRHTNGFTPSNEAARLASQVSGLYNYFSDGAANLCLPCEAGKYSEHHGRTSCTACPHQTTTNGGGKSSAADCSYCNEGTFMNVQGVKQQCEECPGGTYSHGLSNVTCGGCKACGVGYFSAKASVPCKVCKSISSLSVATSEFCGTLVLIAGFAKVCAPGKFANATGAKECTECAPGSFGPQPGLKNCVECPHGQYAAQKGQDLCDLCQGGSYQHLTGQTNCEQCPAGKYTPHTAIGCLSIPSGYQVDHLDPNSLRPCNYGWFSNRRDLSSTLRSTI